MFQQRKHTHWHCAPPVWIANKNRVIAIKIIGISLELGTGLGAKLRLRFFYAGHIAFGVGLHGIDFKQIAAHCLLNELRNALGVTLVNLFQAAVSVVFAFARIVNYKNLSHSDCLRTSIWWLHLNTVFLMNQS